jgi:hypothetical protein
MNRMKRVNWEDIFERTPEEEEVCAGECEVSEWFENMINFISIVSVSINTEERKKHTQPIQSVLQYSSQISLKLISQFELTRFLMEI